MYISGDDDFNAADERFSSIKDPYMLYDILIKIFDRDTCAPRMRDSWSENNRTLGQCSITAFLAQDIFGGGVYGILRPDGNFHCFNKVGKCVFDLTSAQFGTEKLVYTFDYPQKREIHFKKEEKYQRYLLLKDRHEKYLEKTQS